MKLQNWTEEELVELINKAESVLKEKREERVRKEARDRVKRMCSEFRDRLNGKTIKQLARKHDMSTSAMRSDTEKVLRILKHDFNDEYGVDVDPTSIGYGSSGFDYVRENEELRQKFLNAVDIYEKRQIEAL